jgi:hypothetical protein
MTYISNNATGLTVKNRVSDGHFAAAAFLRGGLRNHIQLRTVALASNQAHVEVSAVPEEAPVEGAFEQERRERGGDHINHAHHWGAEGRE